MTILVCKDGYMYSDSKIKNDNETVVYANKTVVAEGLLYSNNGYENASSETIEDYLRHAISVIIRSNVSSMFHTHPALHKKSMSFKVTNHVIFIGMYNFLVDGVVHKGNFTIKNNCIHILNIDELVCSPCNALELDYLLASGMGLEESIEYLTNFLAYCGGPVNKNSLETIYEVPPEESTNDSK